MYALASKIIRHPLHPFVTSQLAAYMGSAGPSCRRWSTRRYILAALAGTLIATIVIIVVSAVLSPAEIHFSVTTSKSTRADDGGKRLNLTLTADNTSQRAGVKYRSIIVTLQYTNSTDGTLKSIKLDKVSAPSRQSPGKTASINVSAFFPRTLWTTAFAGKGPDGTVTPITVVVDTVVLFKYGRVYTRPYDIRVSCGSVDYLSGSHLSFPVDCSEA